MSLVSTPVRIRWTLPLMRNFPASQYDVHSETVCTMISPIGALLVSFLFQCGVVLVIFACIHVGMISANFCRLTGCIPIEINHWGKNALNYCTVQSVYFIISESRCAIFKNNSGNNLYIREVYSLIGSNLNY